MASASIGRLRLLNQAVSATRARTPLEVVAALGAVQAQDYPGALWAIGLRTRDRTETDVEEALANRQLVRTWAMRGTLHIVPAADLRWLITLLGPRLIANAALRRKQLDLTESDLDRSVAIILRALEEEPVIERNRLLERLERGGIATGEQRGYNILWHAALSGAICFGPRSGKQHTFVALDAWVPPSSSLPREEALGRLALGYCASHGPATVADFTAWTGLTAVDVRAAFESAGTRIAAEQRNGREYWTSTERPAARRSSNSAFLLPGFDEFLLGYRDRGDVLDAEHAQIICPGNNGVFRPTIVVGGRVVGTWSQQLTKGRVTIRLSPFAPLDPAAMTGLQVALGRYGRFLGRPAGFEAC